MAKLQITTIKRGQETVNDGNGGKVIFNRSTDNTPEWQIQAVGSTAQPTLNIRRVNQTTKPLVISHNKVEIETLHTRNITVSGNAEFSLGCIPVIRTLVVNGSAAFTGAHFPGDKVGITDHTQIPYTDNSNKIATTSFAQNLAGNQIRYPTVQPPQVEMEKDQTPINTWEEIILNDAGDAKFAMFLFELKTAGPNFMPSGLCRVVFSDNKSNIRGNIMIAAMGNEDKVRNSCFMILPIGTNQLDERVVYYRIVEDIGNKMEHYLQGYI